MNVEDMPCADLALTVMDNVMVLGDEIQRVLTKARKHNGLVNANSSPTVCHLQLRFQSPYLEELKPTTLVYDVQRKVAQLPARH